MGETGREAADRGRQRQTEDHTDYYCNSRPDQTKTTRKTITRRGSWKR